MHSWCKPGIPLFIEYMFLTWFCWLLYSIYKHGKWIPSEPVGKKRKANLWSVCRHSKKLNQIALNVIYADQITLDVVERLCNSYPYNFISWSASCIWYKRRECGQKKLIIWHYAECQSDKYALQNNWKINSTICKATIDDLGDDLNYLKSDMITQGG